MFSVFPSISWSLLEFISIESAMLYNHLIVYHPPSPFTFNLPQHQSFSNESALCIRCSKYWSFSFSNGLSNKYSELISFRIDWFDLLAVQGTCKGIFQHHSSKASVLQCSTFFMFLLLHPYMTIGKTIALLCITASKSAVELGARLILALSSCLFGN